MPLTPNSELKTLNFFCPLTPHSSPFTAFIGTQMNTARLRRNQKFYWDADKHGYTRIILPSPPFSKGGSGGISERRFPQQYA